MPGIFTVADASGLADLTQLMDAMLESATHHDSYQVESKVDTVGGVALGRVTLGFLQAGRQPVESEDGAVSVVMEGELYHADRQRRALVAAGRRLCGQSHAEILLHGYQHQGKGFFRDLSGKFTAAIWDAPRRRLVLVNDRFGIRPLYYAKVSGRLLAAAEIKALLLDSVVSRVPNRQGLAQFFTFGHYLAEDTSFEAVRLLPAGGWLEYDLANDRLSVEHYADWTTAPIPSSGTAQEWLDQIDEACQEAVDCRTRATEHLGIALSGGLDARTILGLIDHDQCPITSLALGIPGCGDHRFASRLAALANVPHHNYDLNTAFLGNFETHLEEMVRLTDGQYLSSCIVMPTLSFYRDLDICVLLRGHAGELMHMGKAYNFSLDNQALNLRDEASLRDWAFSRLRGYMLDGVKGALLADMDGYSFNKNAQASLNGCLDRSKGIEPPVQRIGHLFLTQRVRRETALSLVKFGSRVEIRLPYLDEKLVPLLLAAPPELKLDETIQAHILRRRRPDFLTVPNVNTGTRIGSNRLRKQLALLRQHVLAKLGAPGYQPYERMGLWLRRELRDVVGRLLLDDRCLERGIFQPDTVKTAVDAHWNRRQNHTYLILAMMTFELGQRMLVDSPPLDVTTNDE
ncbi:MAG: hypothetical protein JW818_22840 [Pirellulales bacterium]|nr:hypothetical protein [Pirellulales bacterium]